MLRADPIFFRSLTKGKGSRRTAFALENAGDAPVAGHVLALHGKPEWLHLERVGPGGAAEPLIPTPDAAEAPPGEGPAWLAVPARRRVQLIASVDTDHRFFPRAADELPEDEDRLENEGAVLVLELSGGARVEVPLSIAEVVLERPAFDGTFALDFGTTNSCYAWKRRRSDPDGLARPPACSGEIPSTIYFRDLRVREHPRVLVGKKARLALLAEPSRVYAYVESVKRLLGSDRAITVLDARGRSATYRPEEVAGFVLAEVLRRAEADALDGQRVRRVIATFPALFTPRQRRALQDALLLALAELDEGLVPPEALDLQERAPELQAECDALAELRVDEANAATFRFITGPLLEACFRFNRDQAADVLTFDFGGGTIDVSYLRVGVERDVAARSTAIETRLLGVTGEPRYGGDNVSLELVRLLRTKLAVEAARALVAAAADRSRGGKASEGLDIFDRILEGGGGGDLWGDEAGTAEGAGDDGAGDEDLTRPAPERRLALARAIAPAADLLVEAARGGVRDHPLAAEGRDAATERLRGLLRERAAAEGRAFHAEEAERLVDAVEELLPTRFARYADRDPLLERTAKVFFMDLWREANDRLKPLLVARAGGDPSPEAATAARCAVQEPLERLARYAGVDPKLWSDRVEVGLDELDRMVEPRVRRAVERARDLYLNARDAAAEPEGGGDPAAVEPPGDGEPPLISTRRERRPPATAPPLTVLVTGNASILPAVRRAFKEGFAGLDHELVWDERTRKTSVVQGAVEECLLAREHGREGAGIHYRSVDFLERLPFTIGLYGRFVGFRPVFRRGARPGAWAVVTARENELVGRDLEDLPVYADYLDGAPVRYLGVLDFAGDAGRPATGEDLERFDPPDEDPDGKLVFQAGLRLLPNWEVEYVNPERGVVHRLALEGLAVDPLDDPFSGVH